MDYSSWQEFLDYSRFLAQMLPVKTAPTQTFCSVARPSRQHIPPPLTHSPHLGHSWIPAPFRATAGETRRVSPRRARACAAAATEGGRRRGGRDVAGGPALPSAVGRADRRGLANPRQRAPPPPPPTTPGQHPCAGPSSSTPRQRARSRQPRPAPAAAGGWAPRIRHSPPV